AVTIVGLAKNAGKTTVVNHLLEHLDGRIGLASLGLDGEARDQLTGLAKPRIAPPAGALVLTTTELRGQTPMLQALPFRTAAGEGRADVHLAHAAGFEVEALAEVGEGTVAEIAGALTGPLLELLIREGRRATLIVADATRVLAGSQTVARARRSGIDLAVRRR